MGLFDNIFGNQDKKAVMFRNSSAKIKKKKVNSYEPKNVNKRLKKIKGQGRLRAIKLRPNNIKKLKKSKKERNERILKAKKDRKEKILLAKKERESRLEKIRKEKAEKLKKAKEEKRLKAERIKKKTKEKKIKIPEVKEQAEKKELKKETKKKDEGKVLQYFKTYIPGFDRLVIPGLPKGSSILVEGGPGSGKTLFCLTLLKEMCSKGKKVLYMSFEEPEDRLRNHIKGFGANVEELEKKGLLYVKRFNALDIARSVEALLSEAKKELLIDVQPVLIPSNFHADVVIIDSLTSISSAFSGESSRFRIYMEQLFRYLEAHNISSFLIREVISPTHIGAGVMRGEEDAVSFLSDGIIALYNVFYKSGSRKRALEVLKMRGVEINRKIVEYEISSKGVIIHSDRALTGDYTLT